MTATPDSFKAAWIDDLKSQSLLVALVGEEIREVEYQSSDWVYPCIRVAVGFRPAINRCSPHTGDVDIEIYSEQKSSKQAAQIASQVYELYHGKNFKSNGIHFYTVIVEEVTKPTRSIFSWTTNVKIRCQGV